MKKRSKSKAGKATRTQTRQQRSKPPSQIQVQKHRRLWLASKWVAGTVMTLLGLGATVVALWGPFWPTAPIFSPGYPSNSSPFDVPFTVYNKSIIFPINDVTITCSVENVKFTVFSKEGSISEFNDITTKVLERNYIKANDSSSYTCPLFKIIIIKPDPILKYAKIEFLSEYDSPWPWRKRTQSKSGPWTLDTSTAPPQWIHGTPLI